MERHVAGDRPNQLCDMDSVLRQACYLAPLRYLHAPAAGGNGAGAGYAYQAGQLVATMGWQVPLTHMSRSAQGLAVSQVWPAVRGATQVSWSPQTMGARQGGAKPALELLHAWPAVERGAHAKPEAT